MELPCFHVVNSTGDNEEVVVLALFKELALFFSSVHDLLVFCKGHVLISVAAEHVVQGKSFCITILEGFADTANLLVVISEGAAASGKWSIPGEQIEVVVKSSAIGCH